MTIKKIANVDRTTTEADAAVVAMSKTSVVVDRWISKATVRRLFASHVARWIVECLRVQEPRDAEQNEMGNAVGDEVANDCEVREIQHWRSVVEHMENGDVDVLPELERAVHVEVDDMVVAPHLHLEGGDHARVDGEETCDSARRREAQRVHASMAGSDPKAQREEPQVVRREERLGERAVLRVREVFDCADGELADDQVGDDVDIPAELVARDDGHGNADEEWLGQEHGQDDQVDSDVTPPEQLVEDVRAMALEAHEDEERLVDDEEVPDTRVVERRVLSRSSDPLIQLQRQRQRQHDADHHYGEYIRQVFLRHEHGQRRARRRHLRHAAWRWRNDVDHRRVERSGYLRATFYLDFNCAPWVGLFGGH